ncbi:MAG: hypothetical protein KBT03_07655 [Bacteroidales bacterium]|nr:hypothetical protein [Candidatus Scybalousia scybalohippi]
MKRIITSMIVGSILAIITITNFSIKGNIKPLMEKSQNYALTASKQSSLELGDVALVACYGAQGNNSEFYINNALIADLTNYVIYKKLDFTTDYEGGKLSLEEIKLDDDILNEAIKIKIKRGDEWKELKATDTMPIEFNSIGETEIWVWYELSLCTKENIEKSNGTNIEIIFGVR